MPITNQDGRTLKMLLEWELKRDVTDSEIGEALGKGPATYYRRKKDDDFPSFEELTVIGNHFGVKPLWLQVEFGYIDREILREEPRPSTILTKETTRAESKKRAKVAELPLRNGVPPLT